MFQNWVTLDQLSQRSKKANLISQENYQIRSETLLFSLDNKIVKAQLLNVHIAVFTVRLLILQDHPV